MFIGAEGTSSSPAHFTSAEHKAAYVLQTEKKQGRVYVDLRTRLYPIRVRTKSRVTIPFSVRRRVKLMFLQSGCAQDEELINVGTCDLSLGNPLSNHRPPTAVYSNWFLTCSFGRGLPSTSTYG
jgi:hypothetical protein